MHLDPNIYINYYLRACTCKTNVHALTDLCPQCPIPEVINTLLPETEAEIQMRQLADTPAGFKTHCQERITHYSSEAGLYASKLATPPETHGDFTPEWIWYKFYCLALCKLYKAALNGAPSTTQAKAATLHNLKPDEVRALLKDAGMGIAYTKPGEWAAAFRALAVKGVLKGNAYGVAQWSQEQGYTTKSIRKTYANMQDVTDANELGLYQKAAFNKVVREVDKVLNNRRISGMNK